MSPQPVVPDFAAVGLAGARPAPSAAAAWPVSPVTAWYGLGVLTLVALFATVDRAIFGLVAEPIRLALNISDTQLGLLQGVGGILVMSIAAFPMGWLADRLDRRWVLAAGVLIWSAACLARGFATNFDQLFAATLLLSAGEAGVVPCIYGMIPGLFPRERRIFANSVYVVGLYIAAAAGLAACGALVSWLAVAQHQLPFGLHKIDTWRVAFAILAMPGPLVALLLVTMRIARNGKTDTAEDDASTAAASDISRMAFLPYLRANWMTVGCVAVGSGVIAMGAALRLWAPVIAARVFHATPVEIGTGLGATGVVGWVVGLGLTALITRRYARKLGARFPMRVLWVGGMASAGLSLSMLFAGNATVFFVLLGLQATIETCGAIVSPTLLQDLGPAHLRSRLISLCVVVAMAINSISPVLVGMISDSMKSAPNGLLVAAVIVGVVGTGLACLIFAIAETPFKRTVDALP
jgi:MFS family permease